MCVWHRVNVYDINECYVIRFAYLSCHGNLKFNFVCCVSVLFLGVRDKMLYAFGFNLYDFHYIHVGSIQVSIHILRKIYQQ